MQLRRDQPAEFDLHPAFQRRRFTIAGLVAIAETIFVPLLTSNELDDPPLVYQLVELRNTDDVVHDLRLLGFAHLRGALPADIQARYVDSIDALVAHNAGQPERRPHLRTFDDADGGATTMDFGSVYDPSHVHPTRRYDGRDRATCSAPFNIDIALQPQQVVRVAFITGAFAAGEEAAIAAYRAAVHDPDAALRATDRLSRRSRADRRSSYARCIGINAGALWSKVNMRRVMASYPQGRAFTNEPGVSSNVVTRDAAWFVIGNDHFMPAFSRELLARFAHAQYPSGKLPEYYNALTGAVEDDGLNINDGTPLYILAILHHWRWTGDDAWLREAYPGVARAARYILSQCDDRGLVFCAANDPRGNVWAIASWRNVIPLYTINGAVTEINAECAAALHAAALLAAEVDDASGGVDFRVGNERVRAAMDAHLLNPDNGLYYLNIDVDGNAHTDVTGDQIFPVMFEVCDEETGYRIISRLNSPDFWTPAGLRTASRNDPHYDPAGNVGLFGGVWPGLTWWYAFAAARYHPEFMVRGFAFVVPALCRGTETQQHRARPIQRVVRW